MPGCCPVATEEEKHEVFLNKVLKTLEFTERGTNRVQAIRGESDLPYLPGCKRTLY